MGNLFTSKSNAAGGVMDDIGGPPTRQAIPEFAIAVRALFDRKVDLSNDNYKKVGDLFLARHGNVYGYFSRISSERWTFKRGIIWRKPQLIYYDTYEEMLVISLDHASAYKNIISIHIVMLSYKTEAMYLREYTYKNNKWSYYFGHYSKFQHAWKKTDCIIIDLEHNKLYFDWLDTSMTFNGNAPVQQISNIDICKIARRNDVSPSSNNNIYDRLNLFIAKRPIEEILSVFNEVIPEVKEPSAEVKEPSAEEPDAMCITCLSNKKRYVFLCGHLTYCEECYVKIAKREECPLCRAQSKPIKIII